jgi:hypothetical protein
MAYIHDKAGPGEFGNGLRSVAFGEDLELNINGSTTLRNGITVGFVAHLEGTGIGGSGSPTLDERFVFFRSAFGQVRLGVTEDARQEYTVLAPGGSGIFGVNSPFFRFLGGEVPTSAGLLIDNKTVGSFLGDEDALKLIYFSPSFSGFSFALSYAPNDTGGGQGGGPQQYGGNTMNNIGGLRDEWAAGAAFDHDFGDFKIHFGGGYSGYTLQTCSATAGSQQCENNPRAWHAGGIVTIGKISLGGGYMGTRLVAPDSIGGKRDRSDFDVGISYWDASWGVGAQYARTVQDGLFVPATVQSDLNTYAVNGSYILGPGISLQAQIDYVTIHDDAPGALEDKGVQVMVGSALFF